MDLTEKWNNISVGRRTNKPDNEVNILGNYWMDIHVYFEKYRDEIYQFSYTHRWGARGLEINTHSPYGTDVASQIGRYMMKKLYFVEPEDLTQSRKITT
jgi:hypothetical protein